jgi:glutathione synthase/RimK-type ligase-like ATP-grasp enzyme
MLANKRVLILIDKYTGPDNKNWTFFHESVSRHLGSDIDVQMGTLRDFTYEIDAEGDRIFDRERGFSIGDFDLVIFRFIRREYARAATCASYLQQRSIPYIDSQVQPWSWSKYSAEVHRGSSGLNIIPSVFSTNAILAEMLEADELPFGYPIIIKDVNGRKGRLNFIVNTKHEAVQLLTEYVDTEFIVQQFIENEGDYRLLVMGGEIKLAIYRTAVSGSHLNNTSQGASSAVVDVATLPGEIVADALTAARLEKLEVAGVDVMLDKQTGKHYVIEVNSSPQLATGAVPELKLDAYATYLRSLLKA